jgi:hypothetical protein
MKGMLAAILILALTGCTGSRFHQEEPTAPIPSSTQHTPRPVPRNLSPAARAAAPATETDQGNSNSLMECVTESCKINCSPKIAKRFRPKWCVNFKEPI